MSKQETTSLFKRFCDKDGLSVRAIYKQCLPSIKNWILKNNGTEADVSDMFQDGLLVLWAYCKKAADKQIKVCAFLYITCRNLWLKELRKKRQSPLTNDDVSEYKDIIAEVDELEEELRFAKCLRLLDQLLDELNERERALIKLFYIEKKKDKEIAEILGYKNANTVKVQRFRAFVKLKELCSLHPDFEDFCHKLFA